VCALQFYKWHAELEAAYASEMEEKYKRYADLLNSHRQACEDILGKVGLQGGASSCLLLLGANRCPLCTYVSKVS